MAQNGTYGGGRVGVVKDDTTRSRDPRTGEWTSRDTQTGRFRKAKRIGSTLRSVRRED
jgi:hypothetical protein